MTTDNADYRNDSTYIENNAPVELVDSLLEISKKSFTESILEQMEELRDKFYELKTNIRSHSIAEGSNKELARMDSKLREITEVIDNSIDYLENCNDERFKNFSENQIVFVLDAENQGLDIRFDYSGRGMFGKTCPAIVVESEDDFETKAKYSRDSMGLDMVLYASR